MLYRKRNERSPAGLDTSLIARGTVIRGDLRFSGTLHLDGRIEGTVVAEEEDAMLTLSDSGQVQGEIRVPHALINGHVTGDVHVSARLELGSSGRIDGDLRYHTLEMAAGAQLNGRISRQAEELPRELPAPAADALEQAMPA